DVLTYTITVTNTGNTNFSGLTVTDTFNGADKPTGMTPSGTGWTESGENKTYIWTIGSLKAGAEPWEATYTYTVVAGDEGKTLTNSVTVTGDDVPGEPEAEEKRNVGTVDFTK